MAVATSSPCCASATTTWPTDNVRRAIRHVSILYVLSTPGCTLPLVPTITLPASDLSSHGAPPGCCCSNGCRWYEGQGAGLMLMAAIVRAYPHRSTLCEDLHDVRYKENVSSGVSKKTEFWYAPHPSFVLCLQDLFPRAKSDGGTRGQRDGGCSHRGRQLPSVPLRASRLATLYTKSYRPASNNPFQVPPNERALM